MIVAEQIAKSLPIKRVFLLPGGGSLPLCEAFADRAVCLLHEHSCAVAAEAYAQLTGLGLAIVTTGPGVTNSLTGLAAAYLDSTPLFLLSGQVKEQYAANGLRQRGFQELPSCELTRSITKASEHWHGFSDVSSLVGSLVRCAQTPRQGPVHLAVPLDLQAREASEGTMTWWKPGKQNDASGAVERCRELLAKAERPVLLVGHGARCEGLRELLEAIGLPTLLTWRAADVLPEAHALHCGRPGIAGQRGANLVQQRADLLICVGARLDLGQTGYDVSKFAPDARKLVIDCDVGEAQKHAGCSRGAECSAHSNGWESAVCDGPSFLLELTKPSNLECRMLKDWRAHCKQTYVENRPTKPFYEALSAAMRPDDVMVCGSSGTAAESTLQHLRLAGQRLVFSPGLGSMGFGLPAAIGAHYATGRRVVCVEGDGSFCMNVSELEHVRRLRLPIKCFVIRNGGYASIQRSQQRAGYKQLLPSVPDPVKLARAYGVPAAVHAGLPCGAALATDTPAVIAVDADCELSYRMSTNPPGDPGDLS